MFIWFVCLWYISVLRKSNVFKLVFQFSKGITYSCISWVFLLKIFFYLSFLCFTYSLCRFLHKCFKLLVLDWWFFWSSGLSPNEVFYYRKRCRLCKDLNLQCVFSFYSSTFILVYVLKQYLVFCTKLFYLKRIEKKVGLSYTVSTVF